MSNHEEKNSSYSDEAINIVVKEVPEFDLDLGDAAIGATGGIITALGLAAGGAALPLIVTIGTAAAILSALASAYNEYSDLLDDANEKTPNFSGEHSLNDNGGYGPFPISNAEDMLETEALATLEELNRQFVILSGTLANLNDPLLPEFEQAISDITATIKEAIALLDSCMAEHACGETGDANAGVVEAAVDKGLIQPAFGVAPLADGAGETGDQNAQVLNAGLAQMDDQSSSPQEAARSVVEKLIPSIDQLDARLGGLFEDIVVNGGDAFESLTSTAKGIIDQFAKYIYGSRPRLFCLGY